MPVAAATANILKLTFTIFKIKCVFMTSFINNVQLSLKESVVIHGETQDLSLFFHRDISLFYVKIDPLYSNFLKSEAHAL